MPPIVLPLVATVLVPAGLVLWMASPRLASRIDGLLLALASAAYVAFAMAAGPIWGWIGLHWRWALAGLWLAGLALMLSRWRVLPWLARSGFTAWARLAGKAVVALIGGALLAQVAAGYRTPVSSVDLQFPLGPGRFLVVNGGTSAAINGHSAVPAQSLALDIVALEADGRRADGIEPDELSAYDAYGLPVHAPCSGTVIGARGDRPDAAIGQPEPEQPTGNFVTLACEAGGGTATILLAHLAPASLAVAVGDAVAQGRVVGRVGNSGNSSEPHLHIHAVRGSVADHQALITTAQPLGLRFDGRHLHRNDVVER